MEREGLTVDKTVRKGKGEKWKIRREEEDVEEDL